MDFEKIRNAILKILFPDYDELILFLHSLVAMLFVILSLGSWFSLFQLMFRQDSFFHIVLSITIILIVLVIILLPVIHAFSKRKKRKWEKKIMLYAIVIIDYILAWNVYEHLKGDISSWFIIFPMLNAIQATLVLFGLWFDFITSEKVSDADTDSGELIISSILLIALFYLFHFILHQFWSITFSACIFYATFINKIVIQAYHAIKKIM